MEREREHSNERWSEIRRFGDEPSALEAYEALSELLLTEKLEASAFRSFLNQQNFVALLGEMPLPSEAIENARQVLSAGEPSTVPPEVLEQLRQRRVAFKKTGHEFMERRTRGFE